MNTDTPETDELAVVCYNESEMEGTLGFLAVPIDACRKLERERNKYREAILATLEENRHLADGEDCTLAKLKSAIPDWK